MELHIIKVMLKSLRDSSTRQYETAWRSFTSFLKLHDISEITLNSIMCFFYSLFQDKSFAASTISTYRSAIAEPVMLGFGIDLSNELSTKLMRGFQNLKPTKPIQGITWSLDSVLTLLRSEAYNKTDCISKCTLKTVFLITLATGQRISEVHAMVRGDNFIQFGDELHNVTIFPNTAFMAKNELPQQRRGPIIINSLRDKNGCPHPLCPVIALKNYLYLTRSCIGGQLFRTHTTMKPCSLTKLKEYVCRVIKIANPNSVPKSHDVRKMAASVAFFQNMDVSELCSKVGWSSSRVFYKHYLKQISQVSQPCVVLGEDLG